MRAVRLHLSAGLLAIAGSVFALAVRAGPVLPIAEALRDGDGDTIPDLIDRTARVRGTVTMPSGVLSEEYLSVFVQDATGGIGVFARDPQRSLQVGDLVEVEGKLDQFRGAVQLVRPTIEHLGTGPEVMPARVSLVEATSWRNFGRLVQVEGVIDRKSSEGPRRMYLRGDDTTLVAFFPGRLGRDLAADAFPLGSRVSVVGIVSVHSPGPPHRQGFQVLVRDLAEVAIIGAPEPLRRPWWKWALAATAAAAAAWWAVRLAGRPGRRREAHLAALNALACRLAERSLTVKEVMTLGADTLRKYGLVDAAMLHGLGEDHIPRLEATAGLDPAALAALDHQRIGARLAMRVAAGVEMENVETTPEEADLLGPVTAAGLHLFACIPLSGRSRTMGTLCAFARRPRVEPAQAREVLRAAAGLIGLALENIDMLERGEHDRRELKQLAITDDLTGLYNRRFLEEFCRIQLPMSRRQNYPLAFLLFDLDHFKKVNDTYGHGIGDLVLLAVGERIRALVRASDLPVRYGGDEFLVVMPGTDRAGATVFGERLRAEMAALAFPDVTPVANIRVTVSVGIALYPEHGSHASAVLNACDQALYRAKEEGRDRVTIGASGPSSAFRG